MRKKAIRTDARREYERAWRQANPDKVKANKAKYRAKPEAQAKEKEAAALYREQNREQFCEWSKESYQRNREKRIAKQAEYRANNPDKVKESQRKHKFGPEAQDYYNFMFTLQYGLCAICSKTGHTPKSLGLDHDHRFDGKDKNGWRGLLCMYCNAAIGNFKEDLRMLGGPAKYYLEYWFSRVEGELCQSL